MKPEPVLFALLLSTTVFFTACKKDTSNNNDNTPPEVEEPYVMPTGEASKILGKWQINSIVINNHLNGADNISTVTGTTEDYVDFRTDGQMHTFVQGFLDISNYRVHNQKEITIDGDPATVKVLSDIRLVFYSIDQTGTLGFTEVTYDLKK